MSEKAFSASDFLEIKMNKKLKEDSSAVEGLFCVYQFEIGDQTWNLDLNQKDKEIKRGAHDAPDCTIKMSEENFEKLLKKKLNVGLALITGKIKISGDKTLAMKLGEIFS